MSCISCDATCLTLGDQPAMTVTFETLAGAPIDPSTIVFYRLAPDGSEITEAKTDATNPAVGTFVWQPAAVDQTGFYYWRATAGGNLSKVLEAVTEVRSVFPAVTV